MTNHTVQSVSVIHLIGGRGAYPVTRPGSDRKHDNQIGRAIRWAEESKLPPESTELDDGTVARFFYS